MSKWKYIKHLFRLITGKVKKWQLQTGHTVEVAFYSGGKPYYKLSDLFNTFTERGLDAYQVYEEVSMRMDKKDLMGYLEKLEEKVNANPIKLSEIVTLIHILKERVELPLAPKELIWKMASVAYFDESESPYNYDSDYNLRKIAQWRVNKDVDDFFLYSQLRDLMPLPELSNEIYQALQTTLNKIIKHHSKLTTGSQSQKQGAASLSKGIKSGQGTTPTQKP